jgi:hypothetical protein
MAQFTFIISDEKLVEFQEAFLVARPIPRDENGIPTMSANAWMKQWGKTQLHNIYTQGRKMLAEQTVIIDDDIIN